MKSLIFCAVILLTCTQIAKPLPIEESDVPVDSIAENAIEPESEVYEAIQSDDDDMNSSAAAAADSDGNIDEEQASNDDDDDEEENVNDKEDEIDIDTMEKRFGIDIPICAQYAELMYPLHVSHLSDCGKFYKCSNGRGYLFDCPAGEHFSVKLDRCDYPDIAGCVSNGMHQYKLKSISVKKASDDESTDDDDFDETEVDPRCEGADPFKSLNFAHPHDCSKFYKCYLGKAYVIRCPKGQHWGKKLNKCEHPTIAKCNVAKPIAAAAASLFVPYMDIAEEKLEKMHTILDDPDYTINDERCRTDEGDRFHPLHFSHPSDCQMFYKCFNKVAYKVSCPSGLHYNENTEACDYPDVANCEGSVGIQSAQLNVEQPSIPDCSHGRAATFGIQGSIKYYFECRNREAYLMECGADEFFNVNIMKCDRFPHDDRHQRPDLMPYKPNQWNYPQMEIMRHENNMALYPNPPMRQSESAPQGVPEFMAPQVPTAGPLMHHQQFWQQQQFNPQMPMRNSPSRDSEIHRHIFNFSRGQF